MADGTRRPAISSRTMAQSIAKSTGRVGKPAATAWSKLTRLDR
jgi:hypothetical protein